MFLYEIGVILGNVFAKITFVNAGDVVFIRESGTGTRLTDREAVGVHELLYKPKLGNVDEFDQRLSCDSLENITQISHAQSYGLSNVSHVDFL